MLHEEGGTWKDCWPMQLFSKSEFHSSRFSVSHSAVLARIPVPCMSHVLHLCFHSPSSNNFWCQPVSIARSWSVLTQYQSSLASLALQNVSSIPALHPFFSGWVCTDGCSRLHIILPMLWGGSQLHCNSPVAAWAWPWGAAEELRPPLCRARKVTQNRDAESSRLPNAVLAWWCVRTGEFGTSKTACFKKL